MSHGTVDIDRLTALLHEGSRMLNAGKALEARYAFSEAVRVDSKNAQAFHGLGFTYLLQGKLQDAIICFEESLLRNPQQLDVYHNLATAWRNLGMVHEAVKIFRRALRQYPDSAATYVLLGHTFFASNHWEDAETAFRKALMLEPEHAEAHYHLAVVYHVTGDKEKKVRSLKEAIRAKPNHAMAHHLLAESQTLTKRNPYLEIMEQFYASSAITLEEKIILSFALGKAHDDLKDYEKAFSYYKAGNALKRSMLQLDIYRLVNDLKETEKVMDEAWLARFKEGASREDTPVFVVGLPRSGTSLIEQILASHPQIHGAGELNLIPQEIVSLEKKNNKPFPHFLSNFTPEDMQRLANWYMSAQRGYSSSARHIVDKLPGNFMYLGIIKAMFPNAKIIHCMRKPKDNGLSLFRHYFGDTLSYAYDLYEIGRFMQAYASLMQHWEGVLPTGSIYTVSYENLVQHPEEEIRALIRHCGLPWHEGCLQFHMNPRPVNTASADHVRTPLYTDSIGKLEQYKPYLSALEAGLNY
ncbi:MAG: sulfotransferase [Rickettsiales bacterium]